MFFETKDTISNGYGFKLFGTTHILWLCAFVALCAVSVIVYKKLNTKRRNTMRIIIASIVLFLELLKDGIAIATGKFDIDHLPFHLCGISVILISFSIFKRNKTVENFLYYIGIPGAMFALLTPDWTKLPCINFFHMHSFTIHMFLVLYPFVLVASGEVKPNLKLIPKCALLLVGFAVPALILNIIFEENFMFLMDTADIGFLEIFKDTFGAHQWAFPILLPIVILVMALPLIIANKIRKSRQNKKELVNI